MIEIYKKNEAETNEVVAKSVLILLGLILITGIFCWTGIFDIDTNMINGFILAAVIPLLLSIILVDLFHINRHWVKYVIISCVVLVTGISYAVFTFQSVIVFIIPSIIATFYLDSRVILYTCTISVLNIILSHLFTCFYLFQPWIEPFQGVKAIMLYGALPRILQYIFIALLLYLLSRRFTGFFNGFYIAIQNEKKAQSDYKSENDSSELNKILNNITDRERDVFELLVQGYTMRRFASFEQSVTPSCIIGINSNSANKALCKEFLATALSKEIGANDFYDGFSINKEALLTSAAVDRSDIMAMSEIENEDGSVSQIVFGTLTEEQTQKLIQACTNANKITRTDSQIVSAINDEAKNLLTGSMSVEEIADQIIDNTKIYLSE